MSGDHARVRACKVRMDMEACILLTRAFFWQVSNFFIIKIGSQGHVFVKRGPGSAYLQHPKGSHKSTKRTR